MKLRELILGKELKSKLNKELRANNKINNYKNIIIGKM